MITTITLLARYRVGLPAKYLTMLESTHDPVRIRGTRYQRYTWRGVPGRLCDVIVADAILSHRDDEALVLDISDQRAQELPPAIQDVVLEIGDKAGRYDGAIRRRYALRQFSRHQLDGIPQADLRVIADEDELVVLVRPRAAHRQPIIDTFKRLRQTLEGYNMSAIAIWHWTRYYRHLPYDDAEAAAKAWAAEVQATGEAASWTLAEANRAASRMLYRLSRNLGWRKLTAEEKVRLDLPPDTGQWVHERDLPGYARPSNAIAVSEDPALVPYDLEVLGWEIEEAMR